MSWRRERGPSPYGAAPPACRPPRASNDTVLLTLMREGLAPATAQRSALSHVSTIAVEGLAKRFGPVCAVDDVDLEVARGAVLALLGPNGAGKTTIVRILSTLLVPDAGWARIAGCDVVREADAVRRLIGLSGQYAAVDAFLTGRENLRMIGRLYGLDRRTARRRADELLERVGLLDVAERTTRTYSGGMRRRLDLAASLVAQPAVLFLDEPTAGLDPHARIAVWHLLEELTERGTTLLFTTQDMDEAERLSDRIVVVDRGRVIARGTADELKTRVGGERLELRTPAGEDARQLAEAVASLAKRAPTVDVAAGRVVVPVADGAAVLPELLARLVSTKLRVTGLALRQPTLEDVFLALTGRRGSHVAGGPERDERATHPPALSTAAATATRGVVPASRLANVTTITARNLLRLRRVPTLIALASVQPILFVVLFTYGLGGAIHPPGVERYIDYLLPGIFILSIGFGASQTGVAIAEDLANGMIDRFRSLPIASGSVLAGRIVADAIRNLLVIGLIIGLGSALGFRFHGGPAAALAAVGLAVAVGLAFSSTNALLGLVVRDPESAGLAGLFPVVVLVFASSAFVPVATMPGWLQALADVNPITVTVDALRALCMGAATARSLAEAVAWIVSILAVTMAVAIIRFRRATAP